MSPSNVIYIFVFRADQLPPHCVFFPGEDHVSCSQPCSAACRSLGRVEPHGFFLVHFSMFAGVILFSSHLGGMLVRLYMFNFCSSWKIQTHSKVSDPLVLIIFWLPLLQCSLSLDTGVFYRCIH